MTDVSVGFHPDGHQHGVSIQISINLDETFLRKARELKTAETWFLVRLGAPVYHIVFSHKIVNCVEQSGKVPHKVL